MGEREQRAGWGAAGDEVVRKETEKETFKLRLEIRRNQQPPAGPGTEVTVVQRLRGGDGLPGFQKWKTGKVEKE